MATVVKDFKIKSGLIVEGTNGKINNFDILTKKQADQDYIIGLIGGTATSTNTANAVVKRDENGDFAAGVVTADLVGDVTGTVSDISNHSTDDLSEGASNKYFSNFLAETAISNALGTGIVYSSEGAGNVFHIDENFLNTEITNGARDAVSVPFGGTPLTYDSETGVFGITLAQDGSVALDGSNGLKVNRDVVDDWYDASGSAASVQNNLDDHALDTTTHGVTGAIVGTSDTQTLSNKTVSDNLAFNNGTAAAYVGTDGANLEINSSNGGINVISQDYVDVTSENDATLRSSNGDVYVTSDTGDVIISADGAAYYGSASAGNELATHGYVDNAVSGLSWKEAVHLLWDDANAGTTGATGTLLIDGHDALTSADSGYRILIKTGANRGIWDYSDNGSTWTLTRSEDADAVNELIGAAVYVMEGTQYGATSWVQGNHYVTQFTEQTWTQFSGSGSVTAGNGIVVDGLEISIDTDVVATQTDLSDGLALKQDTLTAGANIDITGSTISVTGLDAADISDFNAAALSATASAYDAAGSAATAEENAKDYADGLAVNYDPAGAAATAEQNAKDYADALDTDDIAEGALNKYYSTTQAKSDAAALLTNATKTNITITGDGNGLVITAENGVGDSTTDDLEEGSTNLYFSDERAIDAISNADIYPNAVIIDNVAKQVATSTLRATAGTHVAVAFAKAEYRSAEFLVKVSYGAHTEISKVLLTLDTSDNIAITEYGIVGTNGSGMSVTADINNADVELKVTTTNNNTTVTAVGTLLI